MIWKLIIVVVKVVPGLLHLCHVTICIRRLKKIIRCTKHKKELDRTARIGRNRPVARGPVCLSAAPTHPAPPGGARAHPRGSGGPRRRRGRERFTHVRL